MKTFRKIASLVIAIAMMATVLVMPAQAAENVYKLWGFDDNTIPTELGFNSDTTKSVADGILYTDASRGQTIRFGHHQTAPLNWTPSEYPYLEMKWSYESNTGKTDATRPYFWINTYDLNGNLIGQLKFNADIDGENPSSEMKVHKYDLAKAAMTANTGGSAATLEDLLNTKVGYFLINLWNKNEASTSRGKVNIDYVKIYNPGIEATVDLTVSAKGVVYDCDSVTLTADVKGATPEKVEFFVNDKLAETVTKAPYSVNYNFTEEKAANKVYALATFSDGTTVKSSVNTDVKSMKSGRVDFDSYLPPYIQRSGATVNNAGEFVYTGTPNAVNVGSSTYNFVKGGFDITKKKYFKMRAKLDGTARNDTYMIGFKVFSPKATTEYGTVYAKEDLNGLKFSKEYQQFVFDITECLTDTGNKIDFTGKTVGLIQMWAMRWVSTGTLTIDWIEVSDDPTVEFETSVVTLSSDKESAYSGETATLTANVVGLAPEKVEFYANGELILTDDSAPYSATYTVTGEKKYNFTAKGVRGDTVTESDSVSVTSFNELRFDFDEIVPPTFGRTNAVLDGKGHVQYYSAAAGAGITINLGLPWLNLKKGGFDPTEYKYLKMRARLVGTAKNDQYTLSGVICDTNASTQVDLAEFVFDTDENGKKLNSEFQELVFDLSKGTSVDLTGKTAGWIQIRPMRQVSPGTIVFDWIELTNKLDESEEAAVASAEIIGAAANETELKYVSKIAIENDPEIVAFGTTFIPLWLFEKSSTDVATVEYNNEDYNVQNGQTYGATLTDIPEEFKGMSIVGKSFIRTADGGYNWSPAVYSSVEDTTINTVE